jgi:hypothetical protein
VELTMAAGFLFATGASIYGFLREQGRLRRAAWLQAAQAAGLTDVEDRRVAGVPIGLRGKAGPFLVHLAEYRHGKEETGTVISIEGLGYGTEAVAFRRERLGFLLETAVTRRGDILLGDEAFDDAVYLRGSPALACAVFDAHTRGIVTQMIRHGSSPGRDPTAMWVTISQAELWDERLRVEVPAQPLRNPAAEALPGLVALARMLARPRDIAARLAQNFQHEPHPGARLATLRVLLETYPRHPRTRETLNAALGDPSHEVRLRAAIALEARETLWQIARDETSLDTQAARALAALSPGPETEPLKEILTLALRRRHLATARACLMRLGNHGKDAVGTLRRVLAVEKHELAAAAATALGHTADPAAETALLGALAGDDPQVLVAVAEALGRVGTAAAVLPLRAAGERVGGGAFLRAERQAVAAIQHRLQGASPGQLSLAGGEAGQMSLVGEDDAHGQLSLPDEGPPRPRPAGS